MFVPKIKTSTWGVIKKKEKRFLIEYNHLKYINHLEEKWESV